MLVAKLPGVDVGDAGDERRAEERQDPQLRAPALCNARWAAPTEPVATAPDRVAITVAV